jgi:hypothetical protein
MFQFFYLHPFGSGRDEVTWALEALGEYSTRSIYLKLSQVAAITHFKEVWRARVHPKIKIFLWQLIRSRLPSGPQVAKRNKLLMWIVLYVRRQRTSTISSSFVT